MNRTCIEFSDRLAILNWLKSRFILETNSLVAIDGVQYVGKSSLAEFLAKELGCKALHCDQYITDGTKFYPEILDINRLGIDLNAELIKGHVILDSVLCLYVLRALKVRPSVWIYIRHTWPAGNLTHLELFDQNVSEQELLEQVHETCREIGLNNNGPLLQKELIIYHKRENPHLRSDILFTTCFPSEDID